MNGIIKNSFFCSYIKKITNTVSKKWSESQIGWLITRNMDDIKTKNSLFYRIINFLISKTFSLNLGGKFAEKIRESVILNILSHYEIGVFLMLFLAPIVPTMVCVALVILTFICFFINSIVKHNFSIKIDAFGLFTILLAGMFFTHDTGIKPGAYKFQ